MQLAKRTTAHNSKNDELLHTIDDHTCERSMQLAKRTTAHNSKNDELEHTIDDHTCK